MNWLRFRHDGSVKFGTVEDELITVHVGDMFSGAIPTDETLLFEHVELLPPVQPGKIVGMANNFHALILKVGGMVPALRFLDSITKG